MKKNSPFKAFSLIELSIVILVIGVLIAGVMEGKSLVQKSSLNSARALTKSSPVAGIKDLLLWYETSLAESFTHSQTTDGATITTWYDINPQSVRKINSTAYNGITKFKENIFGNIPGVYFNNYSSLSHSNVSLVGSNFTIFVVEQKQFSLISTSFNSIIGGDVVNGTNTSLRIAYTTSTGDTINAGLGHSTGNNILSYTNAKLTRRVPIMHSLTLSQTVGTKYWFNGGINPDASGTSSVNKNPLRLTATNKARIGNFWNINSSSAYSYNGYVAEYMIFTRDLKDEERIAIEKYLSQKYKIAITE